MPTLSASSDGATCFAITRVRAINSSSIKRALEIRWLWDRYRVSDISKRSAVIGNV